MLYAVVAEGLLILLLALGLAHSRGLAVLAHVRLNEVMEYLKKDRKDRDIEAFYTGRTAVVTSEEQQFVLQPSVSEGYQPTGNGYTKVEMWPLKKGAA